MTHLQITFLVILVGFVFSAFLYVVFKRREETHELPDNVENEFFTPPTNTAKFAPGMRSYGYPGYQNQANTYADCDKTTNQLMMMVALSELQNHSREPESMHHVEHNATPSAPESSPPPAPSPSFSDSSSSSSYDSGSSSSYDSGSSSSYDSGSSSSFDSGSSSSYDSGSSSF